MKQTRQNVDKNQKKSISEFSLFWKALGMIAIALISLFVGMLISGLIVGTWFPNSGFGGILLIIILLPLSTIVIGSVLLAIFGQFFGKQHKKQNSSLIWFLIKIIIYGTSIFTISSLCLFLMIEVLGVEFYTFVFWILFMVVLSIYLYRQFFLQK